jgi:2-oxoglutarate decarboxylase
MPQAQDPALGVNSWLEEELYHQYQFDRTSVDEGWTSFFNGGQATLERLPSNGGGSVAVEESPEPFAPEGKPGPVTEQGSSSRPAAPIEEPPQETPAEREPPSQIPAERDPSPAEPPRGEPPQSTPTPQEIAPHSAKAPGPAAAPGVAEITRSSPSAPAKQEAKTAGAGDQLLPLRGVAARIAENMTASLSIPVATSQRQVPVRIVEENRNLINKQRALQGKSKLSFTHLIAWAIVKALKSNPALNHAFAENNGERFRVVRSQVNIGLAVDVAGKDGNRSLMVPNIKNSNGMTFAQFAAAYDDIVLRARTNKLQLPDFPGHDYLAHESGHCGDPGLGSTTRPGPGSDYRYRRYRLSGRVCRGKRRNSRTARAEQGAHDHLHL